MKFLLGMQGVYNYYYTHKVYYVNSSSDTHV